MTPAATTTFLFCSLVSAAASAQTWPATDPGYAQPPATGAMPGVEAFGDKGQIVVTADFDMDYQHYSTSIPGGASDVSGDFIRITPTLDFFLAKNLSLGGTVILERNLSDDEKQTTFRLGPQVGYNLALGPALSLWPRVGALYTRYSETSGGADASGSGFSLTVYVPLLFHPVPHFFLGIGPALSVDLSSKFEGEDGAKTTVFGLNFMIGGWL